MSHLISSLLLDGLSIKPEDYAKFMVFNNIIYVHKALWINFTTYNNWCDQDTINPHTHSDIMMLSNSNSGHPYCYAHVLGIYHASVQLNSSRSRNRELHQAEFLWVHWYNVDKKARAGFKAKHQFQLKFQTGLHTFSFVNPANVLHTVHLIPNFSQGTTTHFLGPSIAHCPSEGWQLLVLCQYVSNPCFWN